MCALAGDQQRLQGWVSAGSAGQSHPADGLRKGQRRAGVAVYLLTFWEMHLGKGDLGQMLESKCEGLTPRAWMQG